MNNFYLIIGVVIVVVFIICYTMPKKKENFIVIEDSCRKKCLGITAEKTREECIKKCDNACKNKKCGK
jgi:hypothetical protein